MPPTCMLRIVTPADLHPRSCPAPARQLLLGATPNNNASHHFRPIHRCSRPWYSEVRPNTCAAAQPSQAPCGPRLSSACTPLSTLYSVQACSQTKSVGTRGAGCSCTACHPCALPYTAHPPVNILHAPGTIRAPRTIMHAPKLMHLGPSCMLLGPLQTLEASTKNNKHPAAGLLTDLPPA